jgi:rod shape determining protein RodA
MQGTQSQLDFLPEKHTDFIFTMFSEEWGFAGGTALLAVYGVLLALLLVMALRAQTWFARIAISGTAAMFFVYVLINVAMVTGLLPVVGVSLPLVSHGGTHMATLMAGLGLAMSAHVHRREVLGLRRRPPLRHRLRLLTSVWTWRVAGARGSRLGPDGPVLPS